MKAEVFMMSEYNNIKKSSGFYDLNQINKIPIVDVCRQMLGIPVEKRGKDYWCKSRSERTASTILHRNENTFHDFGSGTHGNVISFVSYVRDVSPGTAISMLAESFHIPSVNPNEGKNNNHISDWEYEQIGLYGDRATKNFTWDFEHTSIERMHELSEKYAVPMNELRVKHPKVYEQLLRKNALPHIYQLRNQYFSDIKFDSWFVGEVGNDAVFNPGKYSEQIKQLVGAEKILERACAGTSLTFTHNEYDPIEDLEKLSSGEVKPSLGTATKRDLESDAAAAKTQVKYRVMDYAAYMSSDIRSHNHTAFLKENNVVVVGFLASEYNKFRSYFEKGSPAKEKQSLDEKINAANMSKATASSQDFSRANEPDRLRG